MTPWRTACVAALAMLATPMAAAAQSPADIAKAERDDGKGGCFYINQLRGNHALGDRAVIFRVNGAEFYRMDFAQRCPPLAFPNPKLILTTVGGGGLVCRAIDLDVKVGEQGPGAFPESCIPSSLHQMTPAEVAAVPQKDLP